MISILQSSDQWFRVDIQKFLEVSGFWDEVSSKDRVWEDIWHFVYQVENFSTWWTIQEELIGL